MSKRVLYNITSSNLQATNISGGTIFTTTFTGGNLNLSGNLNVANRGVFSNKISIKSTINTKGNFIYGTNGNSFTGNVLTNINRLRVSRAVANNCVSYNSWVNYSSVNTQLRSVCWSPELNLFVATGITGSAVLTSPDGINWTSRAISQNNQWNCIAWSPELGRFAAGAGSGSNRIMTSTNGINWNMEFITTNTYNGICWSPELRIFVIVGSTVRSSIDGIVTGGAGWPFGTIPAGTWNSVCWSAELGIFVAVGNSGVIATSTNGNTFTSRTSPTSNNLNSVCWSPELNLFVAVSGTSSSTGVVTSNDGITWTLRTTPVYQWLSIAWSPYLSIFVVVGPGGATMSSSDGITWTFISTFGGATNRCICWSPELNIFLFGHSSHASNWYRSTPPQVNTGDLNIYGNLRIGKSTQGNYIEFRGTSGDGPYSGHTYIGERIYSSGTELSELLLFKGNDISGVSGPDRIRLLAANHVFDTYTSALSGTFEGVGTSGTTRMLIDQDGNVGVGTIAPSYTLDVSGTGRFTDKLTFTALPNSYPVSEMTSNTSILSDGTYIAGNSSHAGTGEEAYRAFDKKNGTVWTCTVNRYNKSTGAYAGAVTTTMSSVSYSGEWLQIQTPNSIILTQYTLTSHPSAWGRSPVTFYLGGSNNGSTWTLLDVETNVSWSQSVQTSKTFYINNTNAYNYYRIVSNSVLGTNNGGVHSFNAYLSFAEVVLNSGSTGLDLATNDNYAEMRVIRNSTNTIDKDLYFQVGAGADSKLFLLSNNTQTMALNGGNVGIGNTNPGQKLDVNGTTLNRSGNAVGGFSENQRLFGFNGSTTGTYMHAIKTRHNGGVNDIHNAFDFYVWQTSDAVTSGGTKHVMSATSVGVGINTTSPSYTLHVNGDIALPYGNVIRAHGHAHSKAIESIWQNNQDQLIFYTPGANNGNAKLCIQHDGNVGIGTTAPAAELHLLESTANNSNPAGIFLDKNSERSSIQTWNYNNGRSNLKIGSNVYWNNVGNSVLHNTNASRGWSIITGSGSDKFTVTRYTNNAGTDYFIMQSSGSTLLSVLPGVDQPNYIRIGRNTFQNIRYHDLEFQTSVTQASSYMSIKLHNGTTTTSQAEVMLLRANGNVGINATAPVSNLCINTNELGFGALQVLSLSSTVNGGRSMDGISFRPWSDGNWIIDFRSAGGDWRGVIAGVNASSVSYNTSSDIRLKENVSDLSNSVDIIKRMRPVEFTWKADNKRDFGFIAQEIYQTLPGMRRNLSSYSNCKCNTTDISNGILCDEDHDHEEPVDKDGNPLYYGLDYSKITPYLTKALQKTINELENLKQYSRILKQEYEEYKNSHP